MKAIVYTTYGTPDVLHLKEVEKPVPQDNEVLIKVHAATVNRSDHHMLTAKPFIMRFSTGLFKPKKPILGTDFAGKIEAVGKKVTAFKVGDSVFGFDDNGLSSHAEYMTFPENEALATIPDNITYEEAAASLEGTHYAYNFINKITLKSGDRVLVNGATGAIGSATVQLSKYFGAHVTAVCNSKDFDLVRSIGADELIDYTKEDFTRYDKKYNFVFDAVGKSTFSKCKPLIAKSGVYISSMLGPMAQNPFLAMITPLFGNKKVIFPIPIDKKGSVLLIKKLLEEGKLKAVIDRKYSLQEIPDAFRYVKKGQKIGNVVITIA